MTTFKIIKAPHQLNDLIRRSVDEQEIFILTTDGEEKALLIGLDALENFMGMKKYAHRKLMPLDEFQEQFQQALAEAGYDSPEKIINLVQEVKQEMATERNSLETKKQVDKDE
jgi:hypothetical protein